MEQGEIIVETTQPVENTPMRKVGLYIKSLSAPTIIVAIAGLLIIGSAAAYYFTHMDAEKQEFDSSPTKTVNTVNASQPEKIHFRIFENYTDSFDGAHINLLVQTDNRFGCSNYSISHTVATTRDTIEIRIGDVQEPSVCLTSIGAAQFSIDLPTKEGSYTLIFQSKELTDSYALQISKERITISPQVTHFSKPEQTTVDRIAEQNILAADCYYNGNVAYDPKDNHCTKFFAEVATLAHPYMVGEIGKMPKNQFYTYIGSDEQLSSIIKKYYRKDFYIKLSTGKGKTFICPFYCDKPAVSQPPTLQIEYLPEPQTDISACNNKGSCIMEVARNTKNEKLCEQLPIADQGDCFSQVGIVTLDENLCTKTGACPRCQRECYEHIAIQKNNPNLCEKMSSIYRDDCYTAYADAKKDISFCSKVMQPGRDKWCLDIFKK